MAVLGIQRAGAAYLPLDTGQPDARIATILADAGVRVVVGRSDAAPLPEGIRLVAADLLAAAGEAALPPQVDIAPDDLAYIIYTSGSTGTPKGVMISLSAAMNTILDVNRRYGVDAGDRILASRMGEAAIEAILDGQRNVMIVTMNGKSVYVPFAKAIKHDKGIDRGALELVKILSI